MPLTTSFVTDATSPTIRTARVMVLKEKRIDGRKKSQSDGNGLNVSKPHVQPLEPRS
jgi:hypothetical protein